MSNTVATYELEQILDVKTKKHKNQTISKHYYVKWKGYPLSQATWEPEAHLQAIPTDELKRLLHNMSQRKSYVLKCTGSKKLGLKNFFQKKPQGIGAEKRYRKKHWYFIYNSDETILAKFMLQKLKSQGNTNPSQFISFVANKKTYLYFCTGQRTAFALDFFHYRAHKPVMPLSSKSNREICKVYNEFRDTANASLTTEPPNLNIPKLILRRKNHSSLKANLEENDEEEAIDKNKGKKQLKELFELI